MKRVLIAMTSVTVLALWGCDDGEVTETPVNECTTGKHNCSPNATCTDTASSFTCTCTSGYTGDGVTCTDIDECSGPTNFVKFDFEDPLAVRDCIQPDVCITRGDYDSLYNGAVETSFTWYTSPIGTQWAPMACSSADPAIDFFTFSDLYSDDYPGNGVPVCMYLPDYESFYDVTFSAWTPSYEGGGGFAYQRAGHGRAVCAATGELCTNLPGGYACHSCSDGLQNGDETGIDCGGLDCPPC